MPGDNSMGEEEPGVSVHIQGSVNILADYFSRTPLRQGEWSLHQEVFGSLGARWGQPQIDLFATYQNAKVRVFFSLYPVGGWMLWPRLGISSWITGSLPWVSWLGCSGRWRCKGKYIIIAPFWPKRAWFSLLQDLSLEPPLQLPKRADLLLLQGIHHPHLEVLQFAAWILSGRS